MQEVYKYIRRYPDVSASQLREKFNIDNQKLGSTLQGIKKYDGIELIITKDKANKTTRYRVIGSKQYTNTTIDKRRAKYLDRFILANKELSVAEIVSLYNKTRGIKNNRLVTYNTIHYRYNKLIK